VADRPGEGRGCAEIVAGGWDFERINSRYARYLKVLVERPGGALRNDAAAKALRRWAAAEREAWLDAVTNDPLLPGRILPSDYPGQPAMVAVRQDRRRVEVLRDAGRQLSRRAGFNPQKKTAQGARDAGQPFVAYATKGCSEVAEQAFQPTCFLRLLQRR
jgi:DNA-binding transcriptional regulator PaaX